jgi:nitrate/nitrite-specific signal transduction histidine kinase
VVLHSPKYYWLKLSLQARFLSCFLVTSLIVFVVLFYVTISIMENIDSFAGNTISNFGLRAANATGDAIEIEVKQQLRDKTIDCTRAISAYLNQHPDINPENLFLDQALTEIAVKPIWNSGYTFLYQETELSKFDSAIFRVHPDPRFNNRSFDTLPEDQFVPYSMSLESNFMGIYYYWKDISGNRVFKFAYLLPVDQTGYLVPSGVTAYGLPGEESRYMLAMTMDVSELRALPASVQDQIAFDSMDVKSYIQKQYNSLQNLWLLVLLITLIFSIAVAYWLAKTVTRPISFLTDSARILAKGDFEHRVEVNAGGEIDELANQFNLMAAELKSSYSDLEKKVEERTRAERRKTEHLQSVNEIGQKISSILNTDELFPFVVNSLNTAFHYNTHIFLIDSKTGAIVMRYGAREYDQSASSILKIDEADSLVNQVVNTKQPVLINYLSAEGQAGHRKNSNTKSEIAVPIMAGGQLLGVTNIESEEANAFDEIDLFTAKKVADQLAVALINAKLYQEKHNAGVMQERNRLARDIHDNLAQGFVGIVLQLEGADQVMDSDLTTARVHIDRAKQLARESLDEARRSVRALRPQTLEKFTLVHGFHHEVRNFIRDTEVDAKLDISGEPEALAPDMEDTLFLILRESLSNIRKHAGATQVNVKLGISENEVELSIRDNGLGFSSDSIKDDAFGLISMRERASLFGGSLNVESEKGKGTLVLVKLPLNSKESHG